MQLYASLGTLKQSKPTCKQSLERIVNPVAQTTPATQENGVFAVLVPQ
jgi:hypothetical protein